MKLHLTKGLLIALMAAAAQTMAAEVTVGESTFASGSSITSEDDLIVSSGVGVSLGASYTVNSLTINEILNLRYNAEYELTVTDAVNVNATFGLYDDMTAKMVLDSNKASVLLGGSYWNGGGNSTAYTTLTLKEGSSLTAGTMEVASGSTLDMGTYLTSTEDLTSVAVDTTSSLSSGANGYKLSATGYETANLVTTGTTLTLSNGSYVKIGDTTYAVNEGVMSTYDTTTYYVNSSTSFNSEMDGAENDVQVNSGATLSMGSGSDISTDQTITLNGGTISLSNSWGDRDGKTKTGTIVVGDDGGTVTGGGVALYTAIEGTGDLTIGGSLNLYATVQNDGDVKVTDSVLLGASWGYGTGHTTSIENGGDVIIAGSNVSLNSGSIIANDGALIINSGASLDVADSCTLALNEAIQNDGTLTLRGGSVTVSDAALATLASDSTSSNYSDGDNGFAVASTSTTYTLVTGDGTLSLASATSVTLADSSSHELSSDGTFTVSTTTGDVTDTTYYVNSGTVAYGSTTDTTTATAFVVADGATLSSTTDVDTAITVNAGGTLYLDEASASAVTLDGGTLQIANYHSATAALTLTSAGGTVTSNGVTAGWSGSTTGEGDLTLLGATADYSALYVRAELNNTGDVTVESGYVYMDVEKGASVGDNVESITVASGATLDLSEVTTLNTSLVLEGGSTLVLTDSISLAGHDLTVYSGAIIDVSYFVNEDGTQAGLYNFYLETLFTEVENFTWIGDEANEGFIYVTFSDAEGKWNNWLRYDMDNKSVYAVPEPTTATLSLLALAGLAARRRRK